MKKTKRVVKAIVAIFALVLAFQVFGVEAKAANYNLSGPDTIMLYKNQGHWVNVIEGENKEDNYNFVDAKFISVKSSNSKVLKIENKSSSGFGFVVKKGGKATVTAKVKIKGKTYTLKKKYTVIDDKPFEYIKYGNKNIYKGKEYVENCLYKPKSGKKISWKLKKGYQLLNATYDSGYPSKLKKCKNGQKLKLKKGGTTIVTFDIRTPENHKIQYIIHFTDEAYGEWY